VIAVGTGSGPEPGSPAVAAGSGQRDVLLNSPPRNSVYRRMTAVCDQVADAALRGADAADLARVFAQMVRKTVMLLDPEFGLHTRASGAQPETTTGLPWNPREASVARLLHVLAAERRPLRVPPVPGSALAHGCLAMPVTVGDTALGYLLVLDETGAAEPDDADLIITSYAATLFALTLARERTTLELGLRYRGTVVDSLVCGHFLDRQDARGKALELGVTDAQRFWVAVARVHEGGTADGEPWLGDTTPAPALMSRLALSSRWPTVVRGPELVMIVPEPQPQPSGGGPGYDVARAVSAGLPRAAPAGQEVTCGVSEPIRQAELAPLAFQQAEHAMEMGSRLGRAGQVIRYEDLGIYRLLLQIGDMHKLWQFAGDVLGPLIDYDATHKVNLIATLAAYLNQHESLKQTARVLRVHVNTVAYRVQRIGQLTSLDLADPDDRLIAHVAVKIIESQPSGGGRPGPAAGNPL
jgi:hypothetical protein